ncbi:hypothetical protein [Vulcanisaeta thermophila]|uniref:hypothetical protein n=1 Tax=Vulcanisaeta thermophila TaxID=867917 RepID=UPI000853B1BB|nr:hypothetical protein [Vulcanisaeta thermophila]
MISGYTLLSIFLVSFISNALPFFGGAYTVYATLILMRNPTGVNTALVALVTALGASVSKNVFYALGIVLRKPLRGTSAVRLISALADRAPLWVLTIILAALPGLPLDDYLYIGSGAARVNALWLNVYIFLGKLVKSFVEIPIELLLFITLFREVHGLGIGLMQFQIIMAVFFTVLGVVIFKVDWLRIYSILSQHIGYLPRVDYS